jgi:3-isopropylmalate/(R)-2-methylmalate dehydratase small subunit
MSGARVWRFGHDINTDLMQPGHALLRPVSEQPRYVFEANRPGWVDEVQQGDVIVAGRNFGTGSSRPASRVLRELGIGAVLAESLNWLFFRNCVNYGLAALECPGVHDAFAEGDLARFDLASGQVVNETSGISLRGRPWVPELLELYEAGGIIPRLEQEGLIVR